MATPWNDDPVGYEQVIQDNIRRLIVVIIAAAPTRVAPTVSLAQEWHRALYLGVPSGLVPDELDRFEAALATAVGNLDTGIPVGASLGNTELSAVLRLMAIAHGEWVRIHPFANGNGRTARVWANWIALRYGLEAFVQLKPRPARLLYAGAAGASMRGDHRPMVVTFHSMLRDHLAANSPPP
ncbi:MAG: Fic family protein [Chloroflexi bacterium]|nr:Fic family protein [Chloroflexota bacterium]